MSSICYPSSVGI